MNDLLEKKVLLIICGGISAYKSLELIRLFKKKGAKIKTILTKSAKEFVTPLSVVSLSQDKVYDDLFNAKNEAEMDHISLSRWADVVLVAPATANTISKLSAGSSDDLASTVILASDKNIFLTPASILVSRCPEQEGRARLFWLPLPPRLLWRFPAAVSRRGPQTRRGSVSGARRSARVSGPGSW